MKKIIRDIDSNIEIKVTNEDEMFTIFHRLNGWMNLQVDDDYYPMRSKENNYHSYTNDYFKMKYFSWFY